MDWLRENNATAQYRKAFSDESADEERAIFSDSPTISINTPWGAKFAYSGDEIEHVLEDPHMPAFVIRGPAE